ncbi:putative serine protease K12H4.7 [Anoplophora glabripennis]|uniref:putative serine protease K12H4.7 n=1 Tax=Anoplophora glabripennis TaxID=217634 RepID=UPI000C7595A9|nr:putative serine protease K12H4.7 [Anoplophora glabripennis]
MKSHVFVVLFCAHHAFALDDTFLGQYENYFLPPPSDLDTKAVTTQYFSQVLDHYDPTNTARWSQRYFVNTQHFNTTEGFVVFLLIGGEGQAGVQWMSAGAWIQTAREYGALLFQLEHRFYGESHPLSDLSLPNLRFLSSQQAIEDIATFISAMNREYHLPQNVKWILFGGSYSGSLATWARQKYPHLIHGVMASSSPVYAHLDFYEYFEIVFNSLSSNSHQCALAMKKSFEQLEYYINNPNEENVTALFNLCLDINLDENRIENNIAYLFERLSSRIAGVVQYHGIAGQPTIDSLCNIFNNVSLGREIDRLAGVARFLYGTSCVAYRFQALLNTLGNTAILSTRNCKYMRFCA